MGQDLRKLIRESQDETIQPTKGHEAKFEALLNKELGASKSNTKGFYFMKIAATVLIVLSLAYGGYKYFQKDKMDTTEIIADTNTENAEDSNQITIGDISPDLKKIEDFYTAGINVQLGDINQSPENKELIDGYMLRLNDLNVEYKSLNEELNKVGPTEATISALIENLKLRLELLFKLKNKLKELKNIDNEEFNSVQS